MRFARACSLLVVAVVTAAAPSAAQTVESQAQAARSWTAGRQALAAAWQKSARIRAAQNAARQSITLERAQRQSAVRGSSGQRESAGWPEVTEIVSRTLRLGREGTFELQSLAGDVVITGGRGDDVRIEATKRVRHRSSAAARGLLREMRIEAIERGGNVELQADQPRSRSVWTAVDYVINLPSRANVVVGLGSGDVRIRNVSGEIRAEAGEGNLNASDVRRVRHLRTMRGTIEVTDAEADELSATTVQGDLLVRNLKGRVLALTSVNGDVRLIDVEANRARVQTTAGAIEYAGPLSRSGRYEFVTHSGNIRVTPSGGSGFDLEAYSFTGDVRSDYELRRSSVRTPAARSAERMMRGTFGDAGAALTVRSFSGDILLVRR